MYGVQKEKRIFRLRKLNGGLRLIRMTTLRNKPVILFKRQIGYLQNILPDYAQKRVHALIVSRGMRGKSVVMPEQICHISDNCILIDGITKYDAVKDYSLCRFAVDTSGHLIGRVVDYALDPVSMKVCSVEILPGYLPPECRARIWVYDYRKTMNAAHTLTIPSLTAYEPILCRRESDARIDDERPCGRRFDWFDIRRRNDDDAAGTTDEACNAKKWAADGKTNG